MAAATLMSSTVQSLGARQQQARIQSGASASTAQPVCFFQPRVGRVYSRRAPSFMNLPGRSPSWIGRSGMWGCGPGLSGNPNMANFMNKPLSEVLQQLEKEFSAAAQQAQQAQQRQRQGYGQQYGRTSYNNAPSDSNGQMRLPVDTIETADAIWYFADLPGMEKKDVQIKANQQKRTITIEGERLQPIVGEDDDKQNRNLQRRFGKFSHTIELPKEADAQLISAKVDKGVLRIKVLKNSELESEVQTVAID